LRTATILLSLAILLLAVSVVASGIGPFRIPPLDVLKAVLHRVAGGSETGAIDTVLFNIRLPRIAAAAFVGAALAAAGAAYQSLFRNPLVSPDILGVSTGAGLGAVIGILLGFPVILIQALGFGGGLVTVAVVAALARSLRPAWTRIAAPPETSGVEKLVSPAGAVMSGLQRPSAVGPVLEPPP